MINKLDCALCIVMRYQINYQCVVCAFRNIVSTVNLDCKLDLKAIALQARNAEYNPKACDILENSSLSLSLLCLVFYLGTILIKLV